MEKINRNYLIIKIFGILLINLALSASVFAQKPIQYHLDLSQIDHHELLIAIEFPAIPRASLHVKMPNSSPGRYAEHNFAKNVYNLQAADDQGKSLPVNRLGPSEWEIPGHDGYVKLTYTLFGNHGDGTYTGIDSRKLHMNMPATFIYGVGMEDRPVWLSVDLSNHPGWSVATQLNPLDDDTFEAPDYYYFYDSPTMVGDIDFRRWTSTSNGKDYTLEIAMMHEGTDEELDAYTEMVKKVVEGQKEVFGSLPDFDYGRYTFLCSYNSYIYGDGMEHRNSTVCSSPTSLALSANRLIGTISHEFFHCWNVERIRPASLEPFNFDQANMSGELWFAEGFTSYYDDLTLCRVGIVSPQSYVMSLTGLLNYVYNYPGRSFRSPIEMSYNAPFVDAATSVDEVNTNNTFISYYSYGAVLGLVLDLSLRRQFEDVTLDDMMQFLWEHYGKPEIPYEIPDLQYALQEVSGDSIFAADFFDQYIYGSDLPKIGDLFESMGVSADIANPDLSDLSMIILTEVENGLEIQGTVLKNNSLYKAGLDKGDIIHSINGIQVTSQSEFDDVVAGLENGQEYDITFTQLGEKITSPFTLKPDPRISLEWLESVDQEVEMRRNKWLKIE